MYMPNSPNYIAANLDAAVPGPPPVARLAEQFGDLENAALRARESIAKLYEVLDPVLLPDSPSVGAAARLHKAPACPIGEKLRMLTDTLEEANDTLSKIHARLAIG